MNNFASLFFCNHFAGRKLGESKDGGKVHRDDFVPRFHRKFKRRFSPITPALLTRMSIEPNSDTVVAKAGCKHEIAHVAGNIKGLPPHGANCSGNAAESALLPWQPTLSARLGESQSDRCAQSLARTGDKRILACKLERFHNCVRRLHPHFRGPGKPSCTSRRLVDLLVEHDQVHSPTWFLAVVP